MATDRHSLEQTALNSLELMDPIQTLVDKSIDPAQPIWRSCWNLNLTRRQLNLHDLTSLRVNQGPKDAPNDEIAQDYAADEESESFLVTGEAAKGPGV